MRRTRRGSWLAAVAMVTVGVAAWAEDSSSSDWASCVGKTHFECRLFDRPDMKDLLAGCLGDRKAAFLQRIDLTNPLKPEGSQLVVSGCKPHFCDSDWGVISIDREHHKTVAAMMVDGSTITIFGDATNDNEVSGAVKKEIERALKEAQVFHRAVKVQFQAKIPQQSSGSSSSGTPREEMKQAEAPVELARQIMLDEHAEKEWTWMTNSPLPGAEEMAKSLSPVRVGDLTGDGSKGYLVAAPFRSGKCGAGGNCSLWIYLQSPQGYKRVFGEEEDQLFAPDSRTEVAVLPQKSNGLFDLRIGATVLRFDGHQYRHLKPDLSD